MKTSSSATDVLLLTLPFGVLVDPAIGLGLLKATLERAGFSTQILYLTFDFAKRVSVPLYTQITDDLAASDLVGEWVFARALNPEQADSEAAQYIEGVLRKKFENRARNDESGPLITESLIAELLAARGHVQPFLDECLERVLAAHPRVVGFSSTFQQNVASLALAARIKQRSPDTFIVFGGANCEGAMGYEISRRFPFVDAVVSGDGEVALPEIVRRVSSGLAINDLPGVFSPRRVTLPVLGQTSGNVANIGNAPTVAHLDDLPVPDYDDYFGQLEQSALPLHDWVRLMFETARGCWWGEKHHCTFCGLNGQGMAFRSKSAERALAEFSYLVDKYPGHSVSVVDNILDMNYFKDFIPQLAERNPGVEVFYEIKANLKKEQLRLLRAAGVTKLQPGIESLSDQVLRIMDKGVRALQNIQLLKWCKELDIWPQWNLIWGFPGEDPAEYARMAQLAPLLTHLPPPISTSRIRIDRFSPNFSQAEQKGFKNLQPYPAYRLIYGLPPEALENLAYYFTYEYREPRDPWQYVEPLANEIAKWQQGYSNTTMFYVEKGERLLLWDERPVAQEEFVILTGRHKFAYQVCDQTHTTRQVFELWQRQFPTASPTTLDEMCATLDELVARGLMIRQDDSYLALATPQTLV